MVEYINQGNNDTRSGFGEGLTELGRSNNDVVALCADLTGSLKMNVKIINCVLLWSKYWQNRNV